jgi:hypothetical protein
MNNTKMFLLIAFLVFPFVSFAHGQDILIYFFIAGLTFIVIPIIIAFLKLQTAKKIVLLLIHLLSTFVVFYFTNDLPYTKNAVIINFLAAAVPIVSFIITYLLLTLNPKKQH